MNIEQIRADFEVFAIPRNYDLDAVMLLSKPPKFSHYVNQATQDAFEAYQAGRAALAQGPRACTCHPDDRPDGPCRERYAASECQALVAIEADRQARGGSVFAWYDPTTGLFTRNKDDPDSGIPAGSCLWPLYREAPTLHNSDSGAPNAEPVGYIMPTALKQLKAGGHAVVGGVSQGFDIPIYTTPQPAAPVKVNAIFETQDDEVIGTTDAKVKRVEWQDDGSLTVVIDYWPQPAEPVKRKRRYAQGTALGEFGIIPMCDQVDDEPVKPTAPFDDPRVQTVYRIICGEHEPPEGEHRDGYVSRLIVDALQSQDREDAERLDWLEEQAQTSRTGVSIDYVYDAEDGYVNEKGYRFMRHRFIGPLGRSAREAIDHTRRAEEEM